MTTHRTTPADLAAAAALGGEMGRRFLEYDWSAHPLGPVDGWSPEVRAAVAVALTSRFPIVLWLGADDLFLVYNDAYLPVLGEKHPAALGARGREVWWDIWDPIEDMLGGVVTSGEATWAKDLYLPVVTAGRPEERYFTFSYSPLLTACGDVDGIFCAVTETTERLLSERRLHVLTTVGAALIETHTVDDAVDALVRACAGPHPDLPFLAVYVDSPDGPAELKGATTDFLPATLDLAAGTRVLTLDGGEEALVLRTAGTGALVIGLNPQRPLDDQYRAFCRLLGDQVSAAFATAASYQHERRRGDALAELDRAKTAFLTNVSHEFRTPLTLLLGPIDDALREAREPAQLERLHTVRRNGMRLLRQVNSLLEFSRAEAGRATATRVRTDLGEFTRQIASSFAELCRRAGLALTLSCARAIGDVDPRMWETIVLNLVSNAVKYTLDGQIDLEVGPDPDRADLVLFRVADTGIGISERDLPHLFDRFYRAGNARGRSAEGSGIGLALVRSLVELHGGRIEVGSVVDVGTVVTIRLPAAPDDTIETVAPSAENPFVSEALQWLETEPAGERDGRPLVLVADDNADMRRHLRRILAPHWDTALYADGAAALEGARQDRPDLIVTDVVMPVLDGFEFVRALRADPDLASIPVLMLSARAGSEAAGEGFAAGADDYLPKPFTADDLLNRVTARLTAASRVADIRHREEMAAALSTARSIDDILAAVLGSLDADGAALGVVEEHGIRVTFAGGVPVEARERYHLIAPDGPLPLAEVIRTAEPAVLTDDSRTIVIHPLRDALDAVVGALAIYCATPKEFDAAELDGFAATAARSAATLDRVRAREREHRIATGFQNHLLDLDRRSTAAVVAARYEPASEVMSVGGDWYLTVAPDRRGSIAVSVGDVVGHGLPAATVMSRLRSATTAAALTTPEPSAVLGVLERCAATIPDARCSTVAYALLDTTDRTLTYACAGHPYPLVVAADGTTRFLEEGRRPPLAAARQSTSGPAGHAELPPGSLVLLYTDGLVERRGEALDTGFARLAAAAASCRMLPVGEVCNELLARLRPPEGYTDDVALLAVRPADVTPESFVAAIPADADELAPLRHGFQDWLLASGLDQDQAYDAVLSSSEALSNAIEHGSPEGGTVSIEAFAHADVVTVTVSDSGQWSRDSSASRRAGGRGRGLTLMAGLAEGVETARTPQGTRVTLTYRRRSYASRLAAERLLQFFLRHGRAAADVALLGLVVELLLGGATRPLPVARALTAPLLRGLVAQRRLAGLLRFACLRAVLVDRPGGDLLRPLGAGTAILRRGLDVLVLAFPLLARTLGHFYSSRRP